MTLFFLIVLTECVAGVNGKILFLHGDCQETRNVSVLDLATSEMIFIGRGKRDTNPRWSPDGRWIAFESYDDGMRIFLVSHDGTDLKMITPDNSWNRFPVWSPDGYRLAYVASDGDIEKSVIKVYDSRTGRTEIWGQNEEVSVPTVPMLQCNWLGKSLLVALLQSRLEELGKDATEGWGSVDPDPENTLLGIGLIGRPGRLSTGIFVVQPRISLLLPSEVMPSQGEYVEWGIVASPNGKWISFESNDGGDREIYLLSAKGAFDLSNHRAADWNPVWSPRGDKLVFESFRSGRRGIYLADPETSLVRPLVVYEEADCWAPTWSPDEKWVAFVSSITGTPEIWLVNVRTRETIQVTNNQKQNLSPQWRPEKKK